jgi:hypothetical protein
VQENLAGGGIRIETVTKRKQYFEATGIYIQEQEEDCLNRFVIVITYK